MIPAFQSTLGEKTLMLSAALLVLFLLLGHMASMIEYIAQESSRIVLAASNFGLDLVYCVAKVFSFVKWLRHRSPSSFYRRAGHWVERKPPARAEFPGRISPIVSVKKARGGRRRA
jgi:hypothetical protein